MKNSKIIALTAAAVISLSFFGCKSEPEPDVSGILISTAEADEDLKESITEIVTQYLEALSNKSYEELTVCATDDLALCRDQTGFYDYVIGISEYELESIDFDSIRLNDDGDYLVHVRYNIICTGSFTDQESVDQPPGEYYHNELFTIDEKNNEYKITDIQQTAEG